MIGFLPFSAMVEPVKPGTHVGYALIARPVNALATPELCLSEQVDPYVRKEPIKSTRRGCEAPPLMQLQRHLCQAARAQSGSYAGKAREFSKNETTL